MTHFTPRNITKGVMSIHILNIIQFIPFFQRTILIWVKVNLIEDEEIAIASPDVEG
jgi:hypothetical protein